MINLHLIIKNKVKLKEKDTTSSNLTKNTNKYGINRDKEELINDSGISQNDYGKIDFEKKLRNYLIKS